MDRIEISTKIQNIGIPRGTVATLAGCHKTDLSAWLNRDAAFAREKIKRVSEIVTDLEHAVGYFPGVALDLRDPTFVRRLIEAVRKAEAVDVQETRRIERLLKVLREASLVSEQKSGLAI